MTGANIDLVDFNGGSAIFAFDLSCSRSREEFLLPAVKVGNIRLECNFSRGTPEELCMLVFGEYSQKVQVDKDRRTMFSYVNDVV